MNQRDPGQAMWPQNSNATSKDNLALRIRK